MEMYNDPPPQLFQSKVSHEVSEDPDNMIKILTTFMQLSFSEKITNPKMKEDVEKRMNQLFEKLASNSISKPVMTRLAVLCDALENKDYQKANQMHVELITQWYNETSFWMLGIKRLITPYI